MEIRIIVPMLVVLLTISCATSKKYSAEGENIHQNDDWVASVEQGSGQYFDPKDKIMYVVGISDSEPDVEMRDKRDEADDNARQKIAEFMSSEVDRFSERLNENNVKTKVNELQVYTNQVVTGAIRYKAHYDKEQNKYYSLFKIDLNYFYKDVRDHVIKVAKEVASSRARKNEWSKEQCNKYVNDQSSKVNKTINEDVNILDEEYENISEDE